MKSKLLFLSLLCSVLLLNYSNAQQTYLPDDVFEQYLIDQGYDTVLDNYVTTANIANLAAVDIHGTNVTDLTGLEDFTALNVLNVSGTLIVNLDVSANTQLTHLNAYDTAIYSLDVSNNITLKVLYIDNTALSSIDVSNNTGLTSLDISNTNINSLDLSNNSSLISLSISDTSITELDVSNNSELSFLTVFNTPLTSLDVSNNNDLDTLKATSTPNLLCITVADEIEAITGLGIYSEWEKDTDCLYSENCTQALSNTDFKVAEGFVGPNPMHDALQIQFNETTRLNEVSIYDISGKLILRSQNNTIATSHLKPGIYLVKVVTDKGSFIKKLVKG